MSEQNTQNEHWTNKKSVRLGVIALATAGMAHEFVAKHDSHHQAPESAAVAKPHASTSSSKEIKPGQTTVKLPSKSPEVASQPLSPVEAMAQKLQRRIEDIYKNKKVDPLHPDKFDSSLTESEDKKGFYIFLDDNKAPSDKVGYTDYHDASILVGKNAQGKPDFSNLQGIIIGTSLGSNQLDASGAPKTMDDLFRVNIFRYGDEPNGSLHLAANGLDESGKAWSVVSEGTQANEQDVTISAPAQYARVEQQAAEVLAALSNNQLFDDLSNPTY